MKDVFFCALDAHHPGRRAETSGYNTVNKLEYFNRLTCAFCCLFFRLAASGARQTRVNSLVCASSTWGRAYVVTDAIHRHWVANRDESSGASSVLITPASASASATATAATYACYT